MFIVKGMFCFHFIVSQKYMNQIATTLKKSFAVPAIVGLTLLSSGLNAQKWTNMDPLMPTGSHGTAVASGAGFDIEFTPYVAGGMNADTVVENNMMYYQWIGNWELKGQPSSQAEAVAFSINNKGYIIGGIDENGNYKNEVWEMSTSGWTKKSNFPGGPRANAVVFVIKDKAYIGTGSDGTSLYTTFYEYTPATDGWKPIASFPGTARKNAIAFTADSTGYVGTGSDAGNTMLNDIWAYNPLTDQWTQKNNFSGGARTSAVGMGLNKKGYLGTGTNGTTLYKDFWEYTAATDSWLKLADLPGVARHEAVGVVSGSKLCIAFGKNASGTVLNDCYYFKNKHTYDFTFSKQKVCKGSKVIITRVTDDLDVYKCEVRMKAFSKTFYSDTVHCIANYAETLQNVQVDFHDKTGLTTIAAVMRSFDVSTIDSVRITTAPDTCSAGVGTATATIYYPDQVGAMAPHTFEWSTNKDTSVFHPYVTLKNLSAGTISVKVTDGAGCQATSNMAVITNYMDTPKADIVVLAADTCVGQVGHVRAFPQTPKLPYTYAWSNGKTTADIKDLSTGKYVLTMTDKNGCVAKDSTIVPLHLNKIKIAFTTVAPGCHSADGSITAQPSNGTAPYTYLWSNGETKNLLDQIPSGKYKLNITDKNGCMASDSFQLNEHNVATVPAICMVTVDSASKHNVITWEKTNYTNVDSFIVYREVSTNAYKRIGAVAYGAMSVFIDTTKTIYFPNTGDPNTGTYRYKLQLLDKCGNYSTLSPYHNTIFIANNNGTFIWPQLYTIEGGANPVNNYALLRDDYSTGNWKTIGTVAGTQQIITDPAYNTYKNTATYRVATLWNITCLPSRLNAQLDLQNKSISNTHGKNIITGVDDHKNELRVELYPNPFVTHADVMISGLGSSSHGQLKLFDRLGKEVKAQAVDNGRNQLERGNLAKGMYFMQILENGRVVTNTKVVIHD